MYRIADAQAASPDETFELYRAWVGRWQGEFIGIMTDPPGTAGRDLRTDQEIVKMVHIASVQKILIHDDLPRITGLPAREVVGVHDEMRGTSMDSAEMVVDGHAVATDAFSYRGLCFMAGRDVWKDPFVVFRLETSAGPWPELTTSASATIAVNTAAV